MKMISADPTVDVLSHVFGAEQALGTSENGILVGIVRVIFRRDFENRGNGRSVAVDGVPNQLRDL